MASQDDRVSDGAIRLQSSSFNLADRCMGEARICAPGGTSRQILTLSTRLR
jgi:hypothetical protein